MDSLPGSLSRSFFRLGLRARIVTTDCIDANQAGTDAQERIRAFILAPQTGTCASRLLFGEHPWPITCVDTWGKDYKDEIWHGTSEFGFTTAGQPGQPYPNMMDAVLVTPPA